MAEFVIGRMLAYVRAREEVNAAETETESTSLACAVCARIATSTKLESDVTDDQELTPA